MPVIFGRCCPEFCAKALAPIARRINKGRLIGPPPVLCSYVPRAKTGYAQLFDSDCTPPILEDVVVTRVSSALWSPVLTWILASEVSTCKSGLPGCRFLPNH